jgi:hypothetical protein
MILPGAEASPPIARISVILDAIKDEEWMANLRYWHNAEHLVEQTFSWPIVPAPQPEPDQRPARRASRARTR